MIQGNDAIRKLRALGFNCQQCGSCCLELGHQLDLSIEETRRWQESTDLVPSNYGDRFLEEFMDIIPSTGCGDLWFHPETGDELRRCPFLRKGKDNYRCLIYHIRPDACKTFPINRLTGEVKSEWADICPEVKRLIDFGALNRQVNSRYKKVW